MIGVFYRHGSELLCLGIWIVAVKFMIQAKPSSSQILFLILSALKYLYFTFLFSLREKFKTPKHFGKFNFLKGFKNIVLKIWCIFIDFIIIFYLYGQVMIYKTFERTEKIKYK